MTQRHWMYDLELRTLRYLAAAVEDRSVSRAAERLGLSQSGLSSALARLRARTGDPLLIRTANGMIPTPCATALLEEHALIEHRLESLLAKFAQFDPETSTRTFSIACPDDVMTRDVLDITVAVRRAAPNVMVSVQPIVERNLRQQLESGQLDLVIGYFPKLDESLRTSLLRRAPLSVIAAIDHPALADGINENTYLSCHHIGLIMGGGATAWLERALDDVFAKRGKDRRTAILLPTQAAFGAVVARTDLIGTVMTEVALQAQKEEAVQILAPPFAMPECTFSLVWHERSQEEPGHRWLRQLFREQATRRLGSDFSDKAIVTGLST